MQLGNAEVGFTKGYRVEWPTRTYKAKPEDRLSIKRQHLKKQLG